MSASPATANWYHANVKSVGRSNAKTRSAVGLVSYVTGVQLYDEENKRSTDRGHPGEVTAWGIAGPAPTPARMLDREKLGETANAIHTSEKRINSHLANHWDIGLFRDGTKEEHAEVMEKISRRTSEKWGVLVVWAVHAPPPHGDDRNWHGHIAHNMREVGPGGFGQKLRLDRQGARAYTNWMRATISEEINSYLEAKGIDERVTHKSYAEQGVIKEPTKHLGNKQNQAELNGIPTPTGNENRAIRSRNEAYEAEIINLQSARMRRLRAGDGTMLSQEPPIFDETAKQPHRFAATVEVIADGKEAYDEFMRRRQAEK